MRSCSRHIADTAAARGSSRTAGARSLSIARSRCSDCRSACRSRPGTGPTGTRRASIAGRGYPSSSVRWRMLWTSSGEPSLVQIAAISLRRLRRARVEDDAVQERLPRPAAGSRRRAGRTGIARGSGAPRSSVGASGVPRLMSSMPMRGVRSCAKGGSGPCRNRLSLLLRAPASSKPRRASRPDRFCTNGVQPSAAPFGAERHAAPAPQVERVDVRRDLAVAKRESRVDRVVHGPARHRERVARLPVRRALRGRRRARRASRARGRVPRSQNIAHMCADLRAVQVEDRIAERRVGCDSTRPSPPRRGARTRRRSRRSSCALRCAGLRLKRSLSCCVIALDRSLAVRSTIGMTRSYAMRVGPMTPSVPTTCRWTRTAR